MILRVTAVRTPEGMWPGLPHTNYLATQVLFVLLGQRLTLF